MEKGVYNLSTSHYGVLGETNYTEWFDHSKTTRMTADGSALVYLISYIEDIDGEAVRWAIPELGGVTYYAVAVTKNGPIVVSYNTETAQINTYRKFDGHVMPEDAKDLFFPEIWVDRFYDDFPKLGKAIEIVTDEEFDLWFTDPKNHRNDGEGFRSRECEHDAIYISFPIEENNDDIRKEIVDNGLGDKFMVSEDRTELVAWFSKEEFYLLIRAIDILRQQGVVVEVSCGTNV